MERYATEEDIKVTEFRHPASADDPLTEIAREARAGCLRLRCGRRRIFSYELADERLPDGRQRMVKHGTGPEREIRAGIGALPVRRPKVRDRAAGPTDGKVRLASAILPRWARRSGSLDALLPILYLRGISMGDFQEALSALPGENAPNLSLGGSRA